jgi:hypothetical protein
MVDLGFPDASCLVIVVVSSAVVGNWLLWLFVVYGGGLEE